MSVAYRRPLTLDLTLDTLPKRTMSALARSLRLSRLPQVALLTIAFVACATAQDPEVEGDGTGNFPAVGGGGAGNAGTASTGGSKGGSLPIAGTNSFPPTAGTTSTDQRCGYFSPG